MNVRTKYILSYFYFLLAKAYRGRKTQSDLTIINPIHLFQHIMSPAFQEESMPFQPVKQSMDQMHLLTNSIDMEHAAQKLPQRNKQSQSVQVAQSLLFMAHPTPHSYTLTRCAMCVKQKKPCMFIRRDPFFHDRSCVLCTAKSVPCIKHPDTPVTAPEEYTLTEDMWKIFNERSQTAQGKDTKEWKKINSIRTRFQQIQQAENRLKLANTHFLARQALETTLTRQPEHPSNKRKRLTTLLSKEVDNSELTRHMMLTSQSKCSMQNCSALSTRKNPIQACAKCNKTWHSLCAFPEKTISTSIQWTCHECKTTKRPKTKNPNKK